MTESPVKNRFQFSIAKLLRLTLYFGLVFAFLRAVGLGVGLAAVLVLGFLFFALLLLIATMAWASWLLHRTTRSSDSDLSGTDEGR